MEKAFDVLKQLLKEKPTTFCLYSPWNPKERYQKIYICRDTRWSYLAERCVGESTSLQRIPADARFSAYLSARFPKVYRRLLAFTPEFHWTLEVSEEGEVSVSQQALSPQEGMAYRWKHPDPLEEWREIPPLQELGIMNEKGRVTPDGEEAFQSLNGLFYKIQKLFPEDHKGPFRVVVFQENISPSDLREKSKLWKFIPFVLYYYLTQVRKFPVRMRVFLPDSPRFWNEDEEIAALEGLARTFGYGGMAFERWETPEDAFLTGRDAVFILGEPKFRADDLISRAIRQKTERIVFLDDCWYANPSGWALDPWFWDSNLQPLNSLEGNLLGYAIRAKLLEYHGYETTLAYDLLEKGTMLLAAQQGEISQEERERAMEKVQSLRKEFTFTDGLYEMLFPEEPPLRSPEEEWWKD